MAVFSLSSALTAAPFYNRKSLALKGIKLLLLYLGIFVQRFICHEYPQNAVRLGGDVQLCRILICLCLEAYKVVRMNSLYSLGVSPMYESFSRRKSAVSLPFTTKPVEKSHFALREASQKR